MNDYLNETTSEKISALVDDEQVLDQSFYDSLTKNSEAKAKWSRYNLVSDILNDRDHHIVDKSWFDELDSKIEAEPTILAPRSIRTFKQKVVKQVAGFGVAATVAMAAIVSFQQTQVAKISPQTNVATAANQSSFSSTQIKPVTLRLNKATESKLSSYLVNHYEHSVSSKIQGVMPYSRIVSVTPAERIVHEK